MTSFISRSTALAAVAIASLLAAAPASAQGDERAVVAAVTRFLDGIRTRDTTLMLLPKRAFGSWSGSERETQYAIIGGDL